jgi:hypothetical protein
MRGDVKKIEKCVAGYGQSEEPLEVASLVSRNGCLHRKHLPNCYGNHDGFAILFHIGHHTAANLKLVVLTSIQFCSCHTADAHVLRVAAEKVDLVILSSGPKVGIVASHC